MARPIKENAKWFRHEANESEDPKIYILEATFGMTGYAFYFKLLEMLCKTDGFKIELNKANKSYLCNKLHCNMETLDAMIKESADENVFVIKGNHISSQKLQKKLQNLVEHRKYVREKKRDAENSLAKQPDSLAQQSSSLDVVENSLGIVENSLTHSIVEDSKVKDKRVKKNIENKLVRQYSKQPDFIDELLDMFCQEYLNSRGFEYTVTNQGKERSHITNLLTIYKAKNKKSTEETKSDMRNWFKMCLNVNDKWLFANMSPGIMLSKMNEIKGFINNGRTNYKTSPTQLEQIFANIGEEAGQSPVNIQ